MKRSLLLVALVLLAACGKAPDPLAGRWDVKDPQSEGKASVMVASFADGKVTMERRAVVMGIGSVATTTSGTYEISGSDVTLTSQSSKIDASSIADPKLREQTVKVMEGVAKVTQGKAQRFVMKAESADTVRLASEGGELTLTRAR